MQATLLLSPLNKLSETQTSNMYPFVWLDPEA